VCFYWFEAPKSFSGLKGLYRKRSLGNTSLSCPTFTLLAFTVAQLGNSSHCHFHQTLLSSLSSFSTTWNPSSLSQQLPTLWMNMLTIPSTMQYFLHCSSLVSQQAHNNHSSLVMRTARFSMKTHQLHCSHEWHISLVPCQFYSTKLTHTRW